jgi:GH43 family beta-xylosidase
LSLATYTNPVYPESFPDPFVLKFRGEYWAYCTGPWPDGRCFGVLRSRDLVHWDPLAGAMEPLPGHFPCYWAPEVTYENGLFYLYYSVGNEETMEIRVAIAARPAGPFEDSGRRLTREPFAIDAHVFTGASGARYLFYATDFLEHTHAGTGTVVDRMLDPYTLAGEPRPVTRARHDWHVYHPNRPEKGYVRWHTVEGPFVLERKGLYYEMFSGGNWQNPTYGVSFAVSPHLDHPEEWEQAALPILRTAGEVIGPGHNSVVRGPDNRQLFCVYHRWAFEEGYAIARVLAIDPLDWAGERMLVLGPSTEPRPLPLPTFADFFDGGLRGWSCAGGRWASSHGAAYQAEIGASGEAVRDTGSSSFLCEVSVRAQEVPGPGAGVGLALYGAGEERLRVLLGTMLRVIHKDKEEEIALPADFGPEAFHLLRLEVDGPRVSLVVDEAAARWRGSLSCLVTAVALRTESLAAEFSGFAMTAGWEDLFLGDGGGWQPADAGWRVENGRLLSPAAASTLRRGPALGSYELVVNARMEEDGAVGWVIHPATEEPGDGPGVALRRLGEGWGLRTGEQVMPLPSGFDPFVDQQFRFRKNEDRVEIAWEGHALGALEVSTGPGGTGLGTAGARVSFEAVRVTAI